MALSSYLQVYNQSLSGSEVEYTLPNVAIKSVRIHALTGAITLTHATGGATLTIAAGETVIFDNRNLQGQSLWLDGTATAEIVVEKGLAS